MFSLTIYDMNEYRDENTLQGVHFGQENALSFSTFCIILRVVFLLFHLAF
jgi:hypothetical protein